MSNQKQVIVIRKDLKMRKGKMCAMAAHASMKAILDEAVHVTSDKTSHDYLAIPLVPNIERWLNDKFTKIVVSVDSEEELLNIYKQAKNKGMLCSLIQDAGLTEFDGIPTFTAVAIGPDLSSNIDPITGDLKLL